MKKLTRIIGSTVIAALMYAVPILLTCAFCLEWSGVLKWLWLLCGVGQFIVFVYAVYENTEVSE